MHLNLKKKRGGKKKNKMNAFKPEKKKRGKKTQMNAFKPEMNAFKHITEKL